METALILRGRLSDSRHIELDEPVAGMEGEVEVVLRAVVLPKPPGTVDVFELIAAAAPGTRSKEDIDRQLAEERGSWGDRLACVLTGDAQFERCTEIPVEVIT